MMRLHDSVDRRRTRLAAKWLASLEPEEREVVDLLCRKRLKVSGVPGHEVAVTSRGRRPDLEASVTTLWEYGWLEFHDPNVHADPIYATSRTRSLIELGSSGKFYLTRTARWVLRVAGEGK